MPRPVYLVNAFTTAPFAGNPAGVVTRADGLSGADMQALAREIAQTETCFVMQGPGAGVDYHLRWFTPTTEVELCGHATVAAYTCLAAEGRIPLGGTPTHIRHATRRGVLSVWVAGEGCRATNVAMSAGVASLRAAPDDPSTAARAIGLAPASLDPELPLPAGASLFRCAGWRTSYVSGRTPRA